MLINCKYCNSKFAINAEEVGFDGRLVKCENCQKEWFQESKPKFLVPINTWVFNTPK